MGEGALVCVVELRIRRVLYGCGGGGLETSQSRGCRPPPPPFTLGLERQLLTVLGGVSRGKSAASVRHYRKWLSLPSLLAAGAVGPSPGLILPLRTSPLPHGGAWLQPPWLRCGGASPEQRGEETSAGLGAGGKLQGSRGEEGEWCPVWAKLTLC